MADKLINSINNPSLKKKKFQPWSSGGGMFFGSNANKEDHSIEIAYKDGTTSGGSARDEFDATTEGDDGGGGGGGVNTNAIVGGLTDGINAAVSMHKDIGLSSAERMSKQGHLTHEVQWGKNIGTNAAAGAKFGSAFGPWGTVIGGGVGAIVGAVGSLDDESRQPGMDEQMAMQNRFQMGLQTGRIASSDTFAQQVQAAKKGIKYASGTKKIEVEKDEIVLRKKGRSFVKVADFSGGKSHEQGGEPYVAAKGDIIFPGNKRKVVNSALRTRNWKGLESMRQALPVDPVPANGQTEPQEFAKGTKGVGGEGGTWTAEKVQDFIDKHVIKGKTAPITGKALLALAEKNDFPIELALIQGAKESNFGTNGAGTYTKNMYNWGNVTAGDKKTRKQALADGDRVIMDSVEQGITKYMKGVKKNYIDPAGGDWRTLLSEDDSFVNGAGNRYAKAANYENDLNDLLSEVDTITPPEPTSSAAGGDSEMPETKRNTPEEQEEQQGYWSSSTPTGQAATAKIKKNMDVSEKKDALNPLSSVGIGPLGAGLGLGSSQQTTAINEMFGVDRLAGAEGPQQVSGFHDSPAGVALEAEAEVFYDYLQHGSGEGDVTWWIADVFRKFDATRAKGYGSKNTLITKITDVLSSVDETQMTAIMDDVVKQGLMTEAGVELMWDAYVNPEEFNSLQMQAGQAIDAVSGVANAPALIRTLGKGGKGLWKLGKLTSKGTKDFFRGQKLKRLVAARNTKKGGKQLKATLNEFAANANFSGEESLDELLTAANKLDADLGSSMTGIGSWQDFLQGARETRDWIKQAPDAMRKSVMGKSFTEIAETKKALNEVTGKTWAELKGLSKGEVGKLYQKGLKDKMQAITDAENVNASKWANYHKLKKEATIAQQEMEALGDGGATPVELKVYTDKIAGIEKQMVMAGDDIKAAEGAVAKTYGDIDRLEGFMSDDLYKDQWRTIEKLHNGVENQMKVLGKNDEIVKAHELRYNNLTNSRDAAVVGGQDAMQRAIKTSVQDARAANAASQDAKKAALADNLAGNAKKATQDYVDYSKNFAKTPKLLAVLEKDAELMNMYRKGSIGGARLYNLLRKKYPEADIEEEELTPEAITPETPRSTEVLEGVKKTDIKGDEFTKEIPDAKAEIPAGQKPIGVTLPSTLGGEKKEHPLEKVGSLLEGLAGYAPAIYNIAKGLEDPEKVKRRFVTPQTKEYQNMSQPQLNAIDDAFGAAIGNSRNLSGGLMANFRANTEKAWADKIKRTANVNAVEAGRADAVASGNIDIRNQADQINTQTHQRADIMDLQSKAATDSFLAQGIKDLSDISNRNIRDRNSKESQDVALAAINSGSANFTFDKKEGISFTSAKPFPAVEAEEDENK